MKKFFIFLLLIAAGVGVFFIIKNNEDKNAWKVEIINDYVNVRRDHNIYSEWTDKALKGKEYKVLEIYLDDDSYIWYKIRVAKDKTGWIASPRENPYIKEINNPNAKDGNTQMDYNPPKLRFFEEVYSVYSYENITYKHLEVKDESEVKIEHVVYYEEHPEDSDIPQYWIKYTATDAAGNKTSKIQRIEFGIEPRSDQVLDFEEYKKNK